MTFEVVHCIVQYDNLRDILAELAVKKVIV